MKSIKIKVAEESKQELEASLYKRVNIGNKFINVYSLHGCSVNQLIKSNQFEREC